MNLQGNLEGEVNKKKLLTKSQFDETIKATDEIAQKSSEEQS